MNHLARIVLVCAAALLAAGCVHPQKEEPRGSPVDPATLGLTGAPAPPLESGWWKAFGDPQLDRLVADALTHNPTLDQALARVRSSEATLGAAAGVPQPHISIDADETWQRFSENYYIPPPFGGQRVWVGTIGANLAWSLDFWGKQAATIRQARAVDLATRLDASSARLAISGALAQAYLNLHRAQAYVDIAQRALEQREELASLTQQRFGAGLETSVEKDLAQARLTEARNMAEQARAARETAVHSLAELTGHGANFYSEVVPAQLTLDGALPVPDALPIDLLARRPDVLAARARIAAADAGRKAAKAAFYPEISLKAFAGTQAIGLGNLTEKGSAVYGVGGLLHVPIFDSQRLKAEYKHSTAELDLAVASYNAVVLQAVRQAADQLTLIDSLAKQTSQSRQRLTSAQAAYDVARQRYGAGLTSQLTLLDAETEVLSARREIVAGETDRAAARINLLLTLGGSFDPARSGDLYGRAQ